MALNRGVFSVVLLALFVFAQAQMDYNIRVPHFSARGVEDADTCVDESGTHFPPAPESNMAACCWYSQSTCCTGNEAFIVGLIANALPQLNNDSNIVTDSCKSAITAMICMSCDPDTNSFAQYHPEDETYEITLCLDYCNSLYEACSTSPEVVGDFTDGTQLCGSFSGYNNVTINMSFDNTDCFGDIFKNVSQVTNLITNSGCVPWGVAGQSSSSQEQPKSSGMGAGEITAIVILALLAIAVLVAVAAVGGFIGYKKWQQSRQHSTYPSLIE